MRRKIHWFTIIFLILNLVVAALSNIVTGWWTDPLNEYRVQVYGVLGFAIVILVVVTIFSILAERGETPGARIRQEVKDGILKDSGVTISGTKVDIDQKVRGGTIWKSPVKVSSKGQTEVRQEVGTGGEIDNSSIDISE